MNRVLIWVDIQNDFLPGGALEVPRGDEVIPVANRLAEKFSRVVATQDWHPAHHGSFAASHPGRSPGEVIQLAGLEQILWPVHCVQDSDGSRFADGLEIGRVKRVFRKGEDPDLDSYSGFFDNGHRRSTGLAEYLRQEGVNEVFILGLATDYCVKFTALDARREGFTTHVVQDGCRAVELQPGDSARALEELREAGVEVLTSDQVEAEPRE